MSLLELLALAAAVFVLTAGATAWVLFELRTPPVLLAESDVIPPYFPVVALDRSDGGDMRCRVRFFSELDSGATATPNRSFLVEASDRVACSADLREQTRSAPAGAKRLLIASVSFGPTADLGPEEVRVFATWDDEVFNRGTYVATPHGFRPVRYERYHAATILFTSVVTGIVVGLLASFGVVCLWRLRANRLAWLPLLAVLAIAIATGTECDLDADANAVAKGRTRARLEMLRLGLAEFRAQHGRYPSDSAGLAALSDGPDPVLQRGADVDGWGRAFRYRVIGDREVQIHSLGRDGIDEEGAGDDMKVELCD